MLCNQHTIFVAAYAFITDIVIITYVNIYNTPTNLKKTTTTQIILQMNMYLFRLMKKNLLDVWFSYTLISLGKKHCDFNLRKIHSHRITCCLDTLSLSLSLSSAQSHAKIFLSAVTTWYRYFWRQSVPSFAQPPQFSGHPPHGQIVQPLSMLIVTFHTVCRH